MRRLALAIVIFLGAALCASPADARRQPRDRDRARPHGRQARPAPAPAPAPTPAPPPPAPPPREPSGPTHAIVAIEITGDADPQLRAQIEAAIVRGLERADAGSVTLEEVQGATDDKPELVGCVTTTCLQRLADLVGAARFLRAKVETSGAAYTIGLELLSPETEGSLERRRTASCAVCTITELGELISDRTRDLVTAVAGAPVTVEITTTPEGATLTRNGVELTASPYAGAWKPGEYKVEARLAGHVVARQTIVVADTGDTQRFELTLVPISDVNVTRPFKIAKWAGAGASVALLVTGAVLIGLDGAQTCAGADLDPPQQCPDIRETFGVGVGVLIGGLAVGGFSGWMFVHDRGAAQRERQQLGLVPTRGGAMATLRFDF